MNDYDQMFQTYANGYTYGQVWAKTWKLIGTKYDIVCFAMLFSAIKGYTDLFESIDWSMGLDANKIISLFSYGAC